MADSEDRTLPATEQKIRRAREEGQVALSREVIAASGLAAAALLLALVLPNQLRVLSGQLAVMLTQLDRPVGPALRDAAVLLARAVVPIGLVVGLAGVAAAMLQTGWLLNTKALMPDLGRLDPRRGLKRVFGPANLVQAGKAAVKIGVIGWAVYHVLSEALPRTGESFSWTVPLMLDWLARQVLRLMLVVLGFQCLVALLDFGWERFRFARQLRMSLEDVKQEQKETDGDPRVKAKIRQIRTARARRRMLAAVAKATVVVTNPTHYAVALTYQRGSQAAPKVVAKGMDELAARIRDAADRHRVPIIANPPLARALHKLPLDAEVPPEHFKAVAEVIAFVWRLRGSASR